MFYFKDNFESKVGHLYRGSLRSDRCRAVTPMFWVKEHDKTPCECAPAVTHFGIQDVTVKRTSKISVPPARFIHLHQMSSKHVFSANVPPCTVHFGLNLEPSTSHRQSDAVATSGHFSRQCHQMINRSPGMLLQRSSVWVECCQSASTFDRTEIVWRY